MLELYRTENDYLHRKVEILLARKLDCFEIKRTQNGKPYLEGNPLYFSISHSSSRAVIAICDKPVGIDLECREKKPESVLKRFTEREKEWIGNLNERFFLNWVSKEAYVKLIGGTLFCDLKRLEYFNGKLYCDEKEVGCGYAAVNDPSIGVYAVCAEGYKSEAVLNRKMKLFRLKKGEKL